MQSQFVLNESNEYVLKELLFLTHSLPMLTVDNTINDAYLSLAKASLYFRDKLLTLDFYLQAYEIRLVQYMHDDISSNSKWYDKGDLFLMSIGNHLGKGHEIGFVVPKLILGNEALFSMRGAAAISSYYYTMPISIVTACFTGCFHGLSNIATRSFQPKEELENLNNLYFLINELSSVDTQNEAITNIVYAYREYKSKQRFQHAEENNYTQYSFFTSDSSMELLNNLQNNLITREYKLYAIKKYMSAKGEKLFRNNGKVLFNIIFNELKEICPKAIKDIHEEKKSKKIMEV